MEYIPREPVAKFRRNRIAMKIRVLIIAIICCLIAVCAGFGPLWFKHATANLALSGPAAEYEFDLLLAIEGSIDFSETDLNDDELIQLIPHFRNHLNLRQIDLSGTSITDGSLEELRDLPNVELIDVSNTKVSQAAVMRMMNSLPNTRIDH